MEEKEANKLLFVITNDSGIQQEENIDDFFLSLITNHNIGRLQP